MLMLFDAALLWSALIALDARENVARAFNTLTHITHARLRVLTLSLFYYYNICARLGTRRDDIIA